MPDTTCLAHALLHSYLTRATSHRTRGAQPRGDLYMVHATARTPVRYPVPPGWDPAVAERDVGQASLEHARYIFRLTGCTKALTRWEKLALELAQGANTLEEAMTAYNNAPEGGPASQLGHKKWDEFSLEKIEAITGIHELCSLLPKIDRTIPRGGTAELRIYSKIDEQRMRSPR